MCGKTLFLNCPDELMRKGWCLKQHGMDGKWGYIFTHDMGLLFFQQLDRDEDKTPDFSTLEPITSRDRIRLSSGTDYGTDDEDDDQKENVLISPQRLYFEPFEAVEKNVPLTSSLIPMRTPLGICSLEKAGTRTKNKGL